MQKTISEFFPGTSANELCKSQNEKQKTTTTKKKQKQKHLALWSLMLRNLIEYHSSLPPKTDLTWLNCTLFEI